MLCRADTSLGLLGVAAGVLSACQLIPQSTGGIAPGIDELQAHHVRQIFGAHCVLKRIKGTSTIAHASQAPEVSVYGIKAQGGGTHPGWQVADIAYRGYRDNLYFNPQTAEYLCGTELWREYIRGTRATQVPTTSVLDASSTN